MKVNDAPRKPGLPSREEMYKILKLRSLELQGYSPEKALLIWNNMKK